MAYDIENVFHSTHYLCINEKRLEHLASLNLPITSGMTVLEVGAGIGDHTSFFIERGCNVTTTEGRIECYNILKQKLEKKAIIHQLDLEHPVPNFMIDKKFDIIHCYGTLYHLSNPEFVLEYLSERCGQMLLLETCVSINTDLTTNICRENTHDPTQSVSGGGCRPTRLWIMTKLQSLFKCVYVPITQPDHIGFPTDWSLQRKGHYRAIFICSREPIENKLLTTTLPMIQQKYKGA